MANLNSKPFLYTALGDSITRGVGSLWAPSFVKIYADLTERSLHKEVKYINVAKNGAETIDILLNLSNENIRSLIRYSNIITLTAGGNDLKNSGKDYMRTQDRNIILSSLAQAQENMIAIINTILFLKNEINYPYIVRIVNLYNPAPYLNFLSWWVHKYNSFLLTLQTETVRVVDVYTPFQFNLPRLIFFDNIHPNEQGYKVIAYQIYNTGYFPLARRRLPYLNDL